MAEVSFWQSAFLWRDALIASCLGAALLAGLGLYIVLSRNAFVTAATTNLAALGVEAVLLLAPTLAGGVLPLGGGIVFACIGVGLLGMPQSRSRIPGDAVLAAVVVGTSALTLLLGRFLGTEYHHVQAVLFGDAVVANSTELLALGAAGALTLLLHWRFGSRFLLAVFDPENARVHGIRAGRWRLALALNIGLALAICVKSLGALSTFALAVMPPLAALALARGLRQAAALAIALGVSSAALGYYLSFELDLPVGPSITALAGILLVLSALVGRVRGDAN